jgi:hypothetical protein
VALATQRPDQRPVIYAAIISFRLRPSLAQPLERPIAELTHVRADASSRAIYWRHRPIALEAKVQDQHSAIAGRQP